MKTILAVLHHETFGGPHNQLLRLNKLLLESGWRTVAGLPVAPGNACERLRSADIKVIQVPLHRPRKTLDPRLHLGLVAGFIPEINALRRIIRQEHADVVQVFGTMYAQGAIAARLQGVPVVWQLLSTFAPYPIRLAMMPAILRLSQVVMTTGLGVAQAHPGISSLGNRLVPFFPPVDTDKFRPDVELRARAREELEVPPGALLVGTVGNFNWQKGHDILVQAASHVHAQIPDVHFRILGEATRTQAAYYDENVKGVAERLGMLKNGRIKFIRPGDRIAEFLPAFDLFVMTSRAEGVPTSILEAMACGIPVVATRVGSVSEVVEEGRSGRLIPPLDVDAAARTIIDLLSDASLRRQFGEQGRAAAIQRYDTKVCAETHLRAFELALAGKPLVDKQIPVADQLPQQD